MKKKEEDYNNKFLVIIQVRMAIDSVMVCILNVEGPHMYSLTSGKYNKRRSWHISRINNNH